MPLSTSNFKREIPAITWPTLLSAVLLAFLVCVGWECWLRGHGYRPSVVDSKALWSHYRDKASNRDPQTLVLLGASRIQLGFSMKKARELYPEYTILQLAINGTNPLPVLADLADDPDFKGIILCSFHGGDARFPKDGQQAFVDYYHHDFRLNNRLNALVGSWLHARIVMLDPYVKVQELVKSWMENKSARPPKYLQVYNDRSIDADYTMIDIELHRAKRLANRKKTWSGESSVFTDKTTASWNQLESYIDRLYERGSKVVFVRLPTSGEYGAIDEKVWPKSIFWDQFASQTKAVTIHFKDSPLLMNYTCPDYSHLDQRDSPSFTFGLLYEMAQKGILDKRVSDGVNLQP